MKTLDQNIGILHALMKPGQTLSHKSIAKIVGCSHGLVFLIEKKALRKVREALRREMGITHGEFAVMKKSDF